jgi:hypothetical protein
MEELRLRELRQAYERGEQILAVHYACEDLYQAKDRPAAVACIAVTETIEGSTIAFALSDAPPSVQDDAREVDLLNRFYQHLQARPDAHILHWNMNSSTYGFAALESRYRYLTASPPEYLPSSSRLYDLDALIADQFGEEYAKHPKLANIAALNKLSKRFFLQGAEEAKKFSAGDIGAVKGSTTNKVKIILGLFERLVEGTLQTQTSVGSVRFAGEQLDAVTTVLTLGDRFQYVQRSLLRRHAKRETLIVGDEYDAQDLLRALLKVFFDDVRDETWTPNYAGGSSRIDFLLPDFSLAIELKYMRESLNDKRIADELIVDRDRYKTETQANHLICLIFDQGGLLQNPRGLEKDLNVAGTTEGMAVTVKIYDR